MKDRIESLDGLRAVSIIGVLYAHASITPHFIFFNNIIINTLLGFVAGDHGVNIFFVISGYLITNLLLKEEKRNGKISIKNFYLRRVFRILPVYLLFLLTVYICLHGKLVADLQVNSFLPPLTFTTGTLPIDTGWTLGHTWSLSVEEQFYLCWPFILFFFKSVKTRNRIALAGIIAAPVLRILYYRYTHNSDYYSFLLRSDCILAGCFLALNTNRIVSMNLKRYQLRIGILAVAAAAYLMSYLAANQKMGFVTVPLDILTQATLTSLLIIAYVIFPRKESIIFKSLNFSVIKWIGVLSYSIYIWQQFFLQKSITVVHTWKYFPVNILLVFIVAVLSYYCIEKPFINLRKSFQTKQS